MNENLNERLFRFSLCCLKFLRTLPETTEYKIIKYQLAKSATSAGANYEESQAGSSRADFNNKVRISLREMRESNYWLRLTEGLESPELVSAELKWLIKESNELKRILGTIVQKTRNTKSNGS